MNRPLVALAGLIVAGGTAGGALLIASPGGEEEVVQQVETARPTPGKAQATAEPNPVIELPTPSVQPGCLASPPPPGVKLWRWGDVIVLIPGDGEIRVVGTFDGYDEHPALEVSAGGGWGRTVIDATTGAMITQDPKGDKAAEIDSVLATASVCPFDGRTAPWPYTGDPPDGPRLTLGKLSYLEPDPATGIQVLGGSECSASTQGGGCHDFLDVRSARSSMYVDAEDGRVIEPAKIVTEEQEAFDRYLATVQVNYP